MTFPYVIGSLEDKTGLLITDASRNLLGLYYGLDTPYEFSSQPFLIDVLIFLGNIFEPVYVWNVFILITILLNLFFTFKLFRVFHSKTISGVITFLTNISPYVMFKMENHPALFCIWLLTLGLYLIIKKYNSYKNAIWFGLFLAIATLVSNYYGYFLAIILLSYNLVDLKKNVLKILTSFFIAGLFISLFAFPHVYFNLVTSKDVSYSQREVIISGESHTVVYDSWKLDTSDTKVDTNDFRNSIEEFFYFSNRPWYYFLWPIDNPIYGDISRKIIEFLQDDWGYWLTQNYFMKEHSAAFIGTSNFILAIVGFWLFMSKRIEIGSPLRKTLINLIIVSAIVSLITMPPFITLSEIKIYTPGYIMYWLFPIFRSTVRLNIIVLVVTLIFTGFTLEYITRKYNSRRIKYIVIAVLVSVIVSEFLVPIRVTRVDQVPAIFNDIAEKTPPDSVLAFYPESVSNLVVFHTRTHKRAVINPSGMNYPEFGFNSSEFTKNLITCRGILEARNLGVTHILVITESDKYESIKNKLDTTGLLDNNIDSSHDGMALYEIQEISNYEDEKEVCIDSLQEL